MPEMLRCAKNLPKARSRLTTQNDINTPLPAIVAVGDGGFCCSARSATTSSASLAARPDLP
jgi:hypothetical protein